MPHLDLTVARLGWSLLTSIFCWTEQWESQQATEPSRASLWSLFLQTLLSRPRGSPLSSPGHLALRAEPANAHSETLGADTCNNREGRVTEDRYYKLYFQTTISILLRNNLMSVMNGTRWASVKTKTQTITITSHIIQVDDVNNHYYKIDIILQK